LIIFIIQPFLSICSKHTLLPNNNLLQQVTNIERKRKSKETRKKEKGKRKRNNWFLSRLPLQSLIPNTKLLAHRPPTPPLATPFSSLLTTTTHNTSTYTVWPLFLIPINVLDPLFFINHHQWLLYHLQKKNYWCRNNDVEPLLMINKLMNWWLKLRRLRKLMMKKYRIWKIDRNWRRELRWGRGRGREVTRARGGEGVAIGCEAMEVAGFRYGVGRGMELSFFFLLFLLLFFLYF
jgi:hypothetical protein